MWSVLAQGGTVGGEGAGVVYLAIWVHVLPRGKQVVGAAWQHVRHLRHAWQSALQLLPCCSSKPCWTHWPHIIGDTRPCCRLQGCLKSIRAHQTSTLHTQSAGSAQVGPARPGETGKWGKHLRHPVLQIGGYHGLLLHEHHLLLCHGHLHVRWGALHASRVGGGLQLKKCAGLAEVAVDQVSPYARQ